MQGLPPSSAVKENRKLDGKTINTYYQSDTSQLQSQADFVRVLRKEWEGNPKAEEFWSGKEKYGELDEAYENAKEILHAKNILNTQDEIFRKLKNRGSDRGSAFGGL